MLPSEWHNEMAKLDRQATVRNLADQAEMYNLPDDVADPEFIEAWQNETIGDQPVPTQEEWDTVPAWYDIDDGYTELARVAAQWVPTTDPAPDCICDPHGTPNPLCQWRP